MAKLGIKATGTPNARSKGVRWTSPENSREHRFILVENETVLLSAGLDGMLGKPRSSEGGRILRRNGPQHPHLGGENQKAQWQSSFHEIAWIKSPSYAQALQLQSWPKPAWTLLSWGNRQ